MKGFGPLMISIFDTNDRISLSSVHSRMRVNLGLAFTHFQALKERLGMKSDAELACFLSDRYMSNTGG